MIPKSVLRHVIFTALKVETMVNNGYYIVNEYLVVTIDILGTDVCH